MDYIINHREYKKEILDNIDFLSSETSEKLNSINEKSHLQNLIFEYYENDKTYKETIYEYDSYIIVNGIRKNIYFQSKFKYEDFLNKLNQYLSNVESTEFEIYNDVNLLVNFDWKYYEVF